MINILFLILIIFIAFLLLKIKQGIELIATDTRKKQELKNMLDRFSEIYLTDKKRSSIMKNDTDD